MNETVIVVDDVLDCEGLSHSTLRLSHQDCGKIIHQKDPLDEYRHLHCLGCGLDLTIAREGMNLVLHTSVDRAEERDLAPYMVGDDYGAYRIIPVA